ncbi:ABC transporter ATP-binding protein/permease [Carboxylicivirga sp. A043]|uniref:ABC transporter ATP-binding protein n=1 Tax=Carboxylicivirga litoralis TaxID=2816963 RepID=UPI0021CAEA49|nr:ABC transporter ATP-binding protein/permease [Carboxylicivirga sp. A043]MCU4158148.1 ABC transporter ATP-binding protein/permease [Carboxylicivirga sp. A043]
MNNLIFSTIKRILQVLPPGYKKKSAKMMVLLFINSVMELFGLAAFLPLFSVILQDGVIQTHPIISKVYKIGGFVSENQFILFLAGFIVFAIIFKNVMSLFILRSQARFSLSLYQYFAIRLHELFYSKGFAFFKQTNSNVIMRDVNVIPQRFANNMVLPVFNFLNELFVLSFILISLVLYDWKAIVLLSCTILPIFMLFYNWVKGRTAKVEKVSNEIVPLLGKSIFQSIFGYTDVEITNSQYKFRNKIAYYLNKLVKLSVKRTIYAQAPTKVIEAGMVITIFAITAYGLFFLPDRSGLAALLGLFALAAYRILPSVNRIMIALISIKGHQFTFDTILDVKEFTPDVENEEHITFNNNIKLNNISFRFPDSKTNLLNKINLNIAKGESIGFIGPSGAGKTTLMNMMLGFWKATEGQIQVDNSILKDSTIKSWRDYVGYVQQEVYILDGTLAENIAFGIDKSQINQKKLVKAIKQASLWNFVQSLPQKMETMIGERGTKLSGGQRQRVGIARAIYSGATILFFDEATSALDSQTEQEITESIRLLSGGDLTIIVIAHRISTLKYSDRIIEINNGSITREVTYEELSN